MYQNMMRNMNPDMMRNAAKNMDNMSDDQIRNMMNMSGMGNMDVGMFRQMSKQMSNSTDNDLNNMKNTASNMRTGNNTNNNQQQNNTYSSYNNNNQKYQQSNQNSVNSEKDKLNDLLKESSEMDKLQKIKESGNQLFKQNNYTSAKEKYYELLSSINTVYEETKKPEEIKFLDDLKVTCRLNIANCYLKLKEYDLVINECVKILRLDQENFKANYRMGVAYYSKKDFIKAKESFDKSLTLKNITVDDKKTVNEYLQKIKFENKNEKIDLDKKKQEKTVDEYKKDNNNNMSPKKEPTFTVESSREEEKESKEVKETIHLKEKAKSVNKILENELKQQEKTKEKENDILIENEKKENENLCNENKNYDSKINTSNNCSFDEKTIEESKNKFQSMVRNLFLM